ncbi:MAG TPA: hypothetical protein VGJ15_11865 [Pirellulales bacterium]|jgi:hypothetical protein
MKHTLPMAQSKHTLPIFPLICLFTIATGASTIPALAEDISIEGWISTSQDKPVANVNVKVWRQCKVIQSATTDKDGHYSIYAVEGAPIDSITFDPPDITLYGPGAIDHLSGKRSQKIGAVLFDSGELAKIITAAVEGRATNVSPLVGQANQLKRVMSLESGAGASKEKLKQYATFAEKLAKQGADAEKKARGVDIGVPKKGNADGTKTEAQYNRETAENVLQELGNVTVK